MTLNFGRMVVTNKKINEDLNFWSNGRARRKNK